MSSARHEQVQVLFDQFVDDTDDERRERLEVICGDDRELFLEVWTLVEANVDAHPILRADAGGLAGSLLDGGDRPVIPGRFGRYVIQRHLADGGMGSVYLAERDGLGDRVAVKFLHDPWSSPARRRRFAAEQRTLAALNHPSIARLYDAGVENATPWFAMEYVPGQSIVQFCQTNALSMRERLRLFRSACNAVAYAHRNLTVHLDLKPSNMLVTDEGEVKLVDFGIARQIGQEGGAADRTVTGHRLLSLGYAAPEQLRGDPVDVQADVYALGAVLYQLLTGGRPIEVNGISAADLARSLTQAPRRPSLQASVGRFPFVVQATGAEWKDLDSLCLKALNHDKTHRYLGAEEVARDIEHLLRDEPLDARIGATATTGYRVRKFLMRNRGRVAASAAAMMTVAALTIFFTLRLVEARDQAVSSQTRLQRVHRLMLNLFEGDDAAGPPESLRVVTLLDRGIREANSLSNDPDLQAELKSTLGGLYHKLGHFNLAEPLLTAAAAAQTSRLGSDDPQTLRTRLALANLRADQSEVAEAERLVRESLEAAIRRYPAGSFEIAAAVGTLGKVLEAKGDYQAAVAQLETAVTMLSAFPPSTELSVALGDLGNSHYYLGHITDSERVNTEALSVDLTLYGERHPHVAVDFYNLGNIKLDRGEYGAGESLFRQAFDINDAWYGGPHPKRANALLMIGRSLAYQGKTGEADGFYHRAQEETRQVFGEDDIHYAAVLSLMGDLNRDRQRLDDAERLFTEAADIFRRRTSERHEFYLHQLSNLGSVYLARRDYQRAEATLRIAAAGLLQAVPDQRYTGLAQVRLARALMGLDRLSEAEQQARSGYDVLRTVAGPSAPDVEDARRVLADAQDALAQSGRGPVR